MNFHSRLQKLIIDTGLSGNEFDLKCGFSEGYTLKSIRNKYDIGISKIITILEIFTEYSPYWLLFGSGEMKKNGLLSKMSLFNKEYPAICITDKNGKVTEVNDVYEKQTGNLFKDIKGKKPGEYLQRSDFPLSAKERIRKLQKTKTPFYEEVFPNYDKLGLPMICRIIIVPVIHNDQVVKFISFANFDKITS